MALTKQQVRRLRHLSPRTGNRIEAAREMLEVTQEQVESSTGLRQSYISAVERGAYKSVTVNKARIFANYFGCSIEDLFPANEIAEVA
jgi:transcriptional regulator with XRE-family HTH domain